MYRDLTSTTRRKYVPMDHQFNKSVLKNKLDKHKSYRNPTSETQKSSTQTLPLATHREHIFIDSHSRRAFSTTSLTSKRVKARVKILHKVVEVQKREEPSSKGHL